ncbi:MAG: flagellar basal body P-ring formation protein FlgA [Myxococcales bacterium]|nr:flagellar basal body P-ring formation protein FlgA [Myxococcales bacterium]
MHRKWLELWPLLFLAGALAPAAASAATPEAAIRTAVAARLGLPEADVSLTDLDSPEGLPADADFTVELPGYALREGHLSVELKSRRGSWRLRPDVALWVTVPVASKAIARGEPVESSPMRVRMRELRGSTPVDADLSWEATTSIAAGQPVTVGRVRRLPDLRDGARVSVVVSRGGISVRAPGELLADAVIGQTVAVLNLATRSQQLGTLQADGTVTLGGS